MFSNEVTPKPYFKISDEGTIFLNGYSENSCILDFKIKRIYSLF
jgi:hypothetical protein